MSVRLILPELAQLTQQAVIAVGAAIGLLHPQEPKCSVQAAAVTANGNGGTGGDAGNYHD